MNYAYNEDKMMSSIEAQQEERRAPIAQLVRRTAEVFAVDQRQLLSTSREARVVRAREAAALIMRYRYNHTLPQIGRFLHRHHTSIMETLRQAEKRYRSDVLFREAVDAAAGMSIDLDAPAKQPLAVFDPGRIEDDLRNDLPNTLRALAKAIGDGEIDSIGAQVMGVDGAGRHWADKRGHFLVKLHIAAPIRKPISANSSTTLSEAV